MPANKEGRPFVLGITGGIASGKSAASEHLGSLGAFVIDADAISHLLTRYPGGEALGAIRAAFGDAVFTPEGALNRRALGDMVFGDEAKRRALEGILHPMIQHHVLQLMEAATSPVVVMNVPLLYETGMDTLCDAVWVMALEPEQQTLRLMNRDQLTREQAQSRIISQMPLDEKARRATAVIHTDRPISETQRELTQLYQSLIKKQ